MTGTALSRWWTLSLSAIILATGSQVALAELGRQTVYSPIPTYPVSNRQAAPLGSPCVSCSPTATVEVPTGTVPAYRPPHRLAPLQGLRVGGGTRALTGTIPTIFALVPEHRGLTLQPHPTLYWFTAGAITVPAEFAIVLERTGDTIAEFRLPPPIALGIHAIRMGDYGVGLREGEAYSWSIALVIDPDRRSKDVLAMGSIERIGAGFTTLSLGTPKAGTAESYAQAGLWYDALHVLSVAIAERPFDRTLRTKREALLREVGLTDIADAVDGITLPAMRHSY